MRLKVIIMSHDTPFTTRALYDIFSGTLDVTVMDVGSSKGKEPPCPADRYPNLYYTGCWREAMKRFGEYDVVWVIGGDVTARNTAAEYRYAIETAMPFGLWSPTFSGYSREVMSDDKAVGLTFNVFHLEGIALAISRDMIKQIGGDIPGDNILGWGVDIWMSWVGWTTARRNVLDGRVSMYHPEGCGYSRKEARIEMDKFMKTTVGPDWYKEARIAPELGQFRHNVRSILTEE